MDSNINEQYDELLTTGELAKRIKYNTRYIREYLMDSVFIEGTHYIRPFGRRKILFIWEAILADMFNGSSAHNKLSMPMASGGVCHG